MFCLKMAHSSGPLSCFTVSGTVDDGLPLLGDTPSVIGSHAPTDLIESFDLTDHWEAVDWALCGLRLVWLVAVVTGNGSSGGVGRPSLLSGPIRVSSSFCEDTEGAEEVTGFVMVDGTTVEGNFDISGYRYGEA